MQSDTQEGNFSMLAPMRNDSEKVIVYCQLVNNEFAFCIQRTIQHRVLSAAGEFIVLFYAIAISIKYKIK